VNERRRREGCEVGCKRRRASIMQAVERGVIGIEKEIGLLQSSPNKPRAWRDTKEASLVCCLKLWKLELKSPTIKLERGGGGRAARE
jgi:hypothetical protein